MKVYKVELCGYVGFAYIAADNKEQALEFIAPNHREHAIFTIEERLTANVDAPCIIMDVLMHNISGIPTTQ